MTMLAAHSEQCCCDAVDGKQHDCQAAGKERVLAESMRCECIATGSK